MQPRFTTARVWRGETNPCPQWWLLQLFSGTMRDHCSLVTCSIVRKRATAAARYRPAVVLYPTWYRLLRDKYAPAEPSAIK